MRNKEGLTRGEEEVMHILWRLGQATVSDIIELMEAPKPKYTTVATFIKILENKGFVKHEQKGKGYLYSPAIEREEYAKTVVKNVLHSYFDGSVANIVSFFSKQENLTVADLDEIMEIVEKAKKS
ncbi:MAG: BlaI/MecI/CopY family transcriptional regulator [Alistipes sp.]|nr:BlaI/MecI/CopY family transcriptional regulator [Alistipes sp.]MBO5276396.1 BlaI/MecI/CopY family transcriptional regulator [Alistipes sp.]MBO5332216.1 BlaI/MecI/CopY family transcriptional regulator [Alistipes sp.]